MHICLWVHRLLFLFSCGKGPILWELQIPNACLYSKLKILHLKLFCEITSFELLFHLHVIPDLAESYFSYTSPYPWFSLSASYQGTQGSQNEDDPSNTTVSISCYIALQESASPYLFNVSVAVICGELGHYCHRWASETGFRELWPINSCKNSCGQALRFCSVCW